LTSSIIAEALALSSRIPIDGLPGLGLTLRECFIGDARYFFMWSPWSKYETTMELFWQAIRMGENKDFAMASERVKGGCYVGTTALPYHQRTW
jgi:hypothetical protein